MLFENEQLSYTRVISFSLLLLLIGVTLYLVATGHNWQHYETLASLTGGGSAATQIANKFINSNTIAKLVAIRKKMMPNKYYLKWLVLWRRICSCMALCYLTNLVRRFICRQIWKSS